MACNYGHKSVSSYLLGLSPLNCIQKIKQNPPCWFSAVWCQFLGSCLLKASGVECRLIALIYLWLTLNWYLDQCLINVSIDTQLTLGWCSIDIWSIPDWHPIKCLLIYGQVSTGSYSYVLINTKYCVCKIYRCLTKMLIKCQPMCRLSIDQVQRSIEGQATLNHRYLRTHEPRWLILGLHHNFFSLWTPC